MEWKNDKVLNLIELYRNRPVLWDCRLKEYKDRNKKIDALTEIAVILQIQRDEIERKIKNLVCHFSRELKKEKECKKSGAGSDNVYRSKWFCFDSMLFLKDRNRPRGMTDMHAQDQKTAEDVDFEEVTQEETVDQIEEPCKKKKKKLFILPDSQPGTRRTSQSSATEKALSIIKNIQVRKAFKDQYTVFGEHVGMRIRDLPSPHAKTIVKHIISTVLFEAEMGKYDNPNSFHPPDSQPTYSLPHFLQPQFSFPRVPEYTYIPGSSSPPQQSSFSGRMPVKHETQTQPLKQPDTTSEKSHTVFPEVF